MSEIPGYSRYETILASYTLLCTFALKSDYSEEVITNSWLKLQNQYPYLHDYTSIVHHKEENNDYSDNVPLKFQIRGNLTIQEGINKLSDNLSKEIIQPEHSGKKNALLSYTKFYPMNDINNIYTLFSLYVSHSRTDLRSMTYFVDSFLSLLEDDKEIIYPIESIYPTLIEKNLIPPVEEKKILIQKYFNYKCPLNFDYVHVKDAIKLSKEEKAVYEEELQHHEEPIYFISRTIKYSASEMNKILGFCKKHELSVQALLDAAYLKAGLEFFHSNIEEADAINFQVIFDHRQPSIGTEKCIGNFPEAAYPYLPISFGQKSVLVIAKALTEKIKSFIPPNSSSLYSDSFGLYRIECYHVSNGEYNINFSFSASNLGRLKCFNELTPDMKEKFVDFTFLAGSQYSLPNTIKAVSSHMYSLFNGSCNHTLHFPHAVIYSPYIIKFLGRIKEIMLNCSSD